MVEFQIIDVTDWEEDKTLGKGSKVKNFYVHPKTRRICMLKYPAQGSGDIWSEKLATEIGKILSIKVQDVDLAQYKGVYGSLSYWFLEAGESLIEGADLFIDEGFKYDPRSREGYNFKMIEKVLSNINPSFVNEFLGILVFDCLIGNTDRHSENWGIIIDSNGAKKLAPAYDNSSSLGRELNSNIQAIKQKLSDPTAFSSYCNSPKGSCFIGFDKKYRIPHLDFCRLLYRDYPEVIRDYIERLHLLIPKRISASVEMMPDSIMNDYCKKFTIRFLNYRVDNLLRLIEDVN